MKFSMTALLLLLVSQCVFSLKPTQMSDSKMKEIKDKIELEVNQLKIQMNSDSNSYKSNFKKNISIEYSIDKYRIDSLMARRIEVDYSTTGMVQATLDAEKSYDMILNKYYKELLSQLKIKDKEVLKLSQRNWVKYRNAEWKLLSKLTSDEYSGGGTIQRINVAVRAQKITQDRVKDIIGYLLMLNK